MGVRRRSTAALVMLMIVVTATATHGGAVAAATKGCPQLYPIKLGWPSGAATAEADILACTDAQYSAVWFLNEGDFVWRMWAVGGAAPVTQHTDTPEAEARRAAIADIYRYQVLGPDTWLTVHAYPSDVRVYPDDDLSALWWTHVLLSDIIIDEVGDWTTWAATQRSRASGTLATCAIAAASAVEDIGTLRTDDDSVEQFLAAIGLAASGGTCARSWANLADDVDLPPWRRSVLSLTRSVGFVDEAGSFLSRLNTLSKLIPRIP